MKLEDNTVFPKTIHVKQDVSVSGDEKWLSVVEDDMEMDENGQAIALYQLVSIGRVKITKEII